MPVNEPQHLQVELQWTLFSQDLRHGEGLPLGWGHAEHVVGRLDEAVVVAAQRLEPDAACAGRVEAVGAAQVLTRVAMQRLVQEDLPVCGHVARQTCNNLPPIPQPGPTKIPTHTQPPEIIVSDM
jgi:hypothetical protein